MRTKSRPPKKDVERNSGINNNNNNYHRNKQEDSEASQRRLKQRRMKQYAAMFAVLVAAITAAILLLKDGAVENGEKNAGNVPNAPSSSPLAPSPTLPPDNGKNDDQSPFIPSIGTDSPTLAPPLLPTLTLSAPPVPPPSQLPTTVPSVTPSTSFPSSSPTDEDHLLDTFDQEVATTTNFQIVQRVSHDPFAFTQGLYYDSDTGMLIEGTGIYGESLVRIWNPLTGQVFKETPKLDRAFFGEGVAWFLDQDGNERFIQLTWQEQRAFIYDTDLNLIQSIDYDGQTTTNEGWGITFDPVEKIFYVSDGSRYIHVWDLNFQLVRKFNVSWKADNGNTNAVLNLNELEWDPTSRTILSNVWYKDYIVRIWPGNGKVIQAYDMSSLQSGGGNVLNGIAHHSHNNWWITGKKWRNLYLIEFYE